MARHLVKKFLSLAIVLLIPSVAVLAGAQEPTEYLLRTMGGGTATLSDEQTYSGLWSAKLTTTLGFTDVGMVRFEFAPGFKLDDLYTLSYCEYVAARDDGTFVDVFVDIWLDFDGDGDADVDDYHGYMQAEPVYTVGAAPLEQWVCVDAMNLKWSTYVGPDYPYWGPSIYNFQNLTYTSPPPPRDTWTIDTWTNGVDFGQLDILRVDVRVGYGYTWDKFTGYADFVQINDYIQSFEAFDTAGDCISAYISTYCSGTRGRERAECIQDQIGACHELFGIPSTHNQ